MSYATKDLTGQIFDRLIVLGITDKRSKDNRIMWKCKCYCGKIVIVPGHSLTNRNTRSCGCSRKGKNIKNLTGQKFNRLTVLEITNKRGGTEVLWRCKCDCGKETLVRGRSLTDGRTKSCGCLQKELTHNRFFKDASNSIVNGIQILTITSKKYKSTNTFYLAICPVCKREDWEVNIASIKNGASTQCFKCKLQQSISKSSTELLDNLATYLGTEIIREQQVDYKFYDGYVKELKLLIEIDGTYWHLGEEKEQNDLFKENLAKEKGFNFIRITCDELKEVPTVLPKLIKKVSQINIIKYKDGM